MSVELLKSDDLRGYPHYRFNTPIIVPTLRVGMLKRTLQRPRFGLCFIDLRFNNEDAGASTEAFQRRALER